jgi:hypothetical protein
MPAEALVSRLPVTNVVSFFSSALANISRDPTVRCFSIGANLVPIKIDGRAATLSDLFKDCGVSTFDVANLAESGPAALSGERNA